MRMQMQMQMQAHAGAQTCGERVGPLLYLWFLQVFDKVMEGGILLPRFVQAWVCFRRLLRTPTAGWLLQRLAGLDVMHAA